MWNIYGKSVTRTFLGAFFLGAHIVQTVPKYIWMQHCFFLSVLNMCYPNYPARAVGFRKCKDKQILLNLYFSMYFIAFIGLTFNGKKQTKKKMSRIQRRNNLMKTLSTEDIHKVMDKYGGGMPYLSSNLYWNIFDYKYVYNNDFKKCLHKDAKRHIAR